MQQVPEPLAGVALVQQQVNDGRARRLDVRAELAHLLALAAVERVVDDARDRLQEPAVAPGAELRAVAGELLEPGGDLAERS